MSDSVQPHRRQPTRLPRPWDSPGKNTGVACHFLLQCMKMKSESEVAQSCPTLSDPMDCSLPGSSVHGICQARVLEWGAIAFSGTLIHSWKESKMVQPLWKTVWEFKRLNVYLPLNQTILLLGSYLTEMKACTWRLLHECSELLFCDNQKLEIDQCSINKRMDKLTKVYPHHRILVSKNKK